MTVRRARFAGTFYPGEQESLQTTIANYLGRDRDKRSVCGIVVPHAGYVYSGAVAGQVYGAINIPRYCVILSPNHTGLGAKVAIHPGTQWETPLGPIAVAEDLCQALARSLPFVELDEVAHQKEHSLEVQLPFLRCRRPDCRIIPITVKRLSMDEIVSLGQALAALPQKSGFSPDELLIIASSDMNHYESAAVGGKKDEQVIARLLELDVDGLVSTVFAESVSMCGVFPSAVMLEAVCRLGAKRAELIAYSHSGEISGDFDQVVGYAGLIFAAI